MNLSREMMWEFAYDALGNRTSVLDPLERQTNTAYDLLSRPTQVQQPAAASAARATSTSIATPLANSRP